MAPTEDPDEPELADSDPPDVLAALAAADLGDAAGLEALRRRYCPTCRMKQSAPDPERDDTCLRRRCGLRDPRLLVGEAQWAYSMLALLEASTPPPPDVVRFLNGYIWDHAAVTPGLTITSDGTYAFSHRIRSLRGALHLAVLTRLARGRGDDAVFSIADTSTAQARAEIGKLRNERAERKRAQADELRRQGVPDRQIARLLNIPPKSIRDWLHPKEQPAGRRGGRRHPRWGKRA
jgi:hypothetical protein